MVRREQGGGEKLVRVVQPDVCPAWCQGCRPNDPKHHSRLATVGREGSGWISVQLIADRGVAYAPLVKVDATRYGSTETVLLTFAQMTRVIGEVIHLPYPIGAQQLKEDQLLGDQEGD